MESVECTLTPPHRYAIVNPGIARGSYPTLRNFRFLSRLQLKTIIHLTPETPTEDLSLFCQMAGVKSIHFSITRTAVLSDTMKSSLIEALNICLDPKNYPLFIHCLDGRRISALLVLLIRRAQGWTPISSLSEYWRYQVSSRSPIPTSEVEKTTKELEKFAVSCEDIMIPEIIPKSWLWGGDKNVTVVGVMLKKNNCNITSTNMNNTSGINKPTISSNNISEKLPSSSET